MALAWEQNPSLPLRLKRVELGAFTSGDWNLAPMSEWPRDVPKLDPVKAPDLRVPAKRAGPLRPGQQSSGWTDWTQS